MSVSNGPTEKHITKFLLPYSERIIKVDDVEDISSAKENLKELMDIYDQMGQRKEEEDEESRALGEAIERQKAEIEKLKERLNATDMSFLLKNTEELAETYGLKMYDVDDLMGVSTGYIAKAAAPGSKRRLSVDIVTKIGKLFHINLDTLINADITLPSKDLKRAIEFILRLISETDGENMHWKQYDKGIKEGRTNNFFFKMDKNGKPSYAPNGEESTNNAAGRIYVTETKAGDLYIVQVEDILFSSVDYELYLYDEEGYRDHIECGEDVPPLTKMCFSADDGTGLLRARMSELYNSIVTHERDFVIGTAARSYMDIIMDSGNVGVNIDEELPFS